LLYYTANIKSEGRAWVYKQRKGISKGYGCPCCIFLSLFEDPKLDTAKPNETNIPTTRRAGIMGPPITLKATDVAPTATAAKKNGEFKITSRRHRYIKKLANAKVAIPVPPPLFFFRDFNIFNTSGISLRCLSFVD
jgi:hypothetical protein